LHIVPTVGVNNAAPIILGLAKFLIFCKKYFLGEQDLSRNECAEVPQKVTPPKKCISKVSSLSELYAYQASVPWCEKGSPF